MDLPQPLDAKVEHYHGPGYPAAVSRLNELFAKIPEEGEKLKAFLEKFGNNLGTPTAKTGHHTKDGHQCRAVLFVRQHNGRVFGVSLPGPTRSAAIYSDRTGPEDRERFALILVEALEAQLAAA